MKHAILIVLSFLANTASAEFSVVCMQDGRTRITLDDRSVGEQWDLVDRFNPLIDGKGITPSKNSGDLLEFELYLGSALTEIYAFQGGLKECESEGTSDNIDLIFSHRNSSGFERKIKELKCSCAAD